jgi:hypothetical protein
LQKHIAVLGNFSATFLARQLSRSSGRKLPLNQTSLPESPTIDCQLRLRNRRRQERKDSAKRTSGPGVSNPNFSGREIK